ncbi:MAG: type II toxin-antitoxin system VapC family toxin [Tepidisphaeraceae bacterium]|jgi:predicted nucleic acid-binding protein
MRLYLDSSTIVYCLESALPFRQKALARVTQAEGIAGGMLLTSRLSRLECRVKPLRDGNTTLLAIYDEFFTRGSLRVIEIGPGIVERATELRVRYGLKTPDAIHVATAIEEHADAFLTGDRDLRRCGEVAVEVL